MPMFFKIGEDGRKVYVAKTLFAKEIKNEDFEKNAKRISVDDFLAKFPKELSDKLEKIIDRVKKISDMDLKSVKVQSLSHPIDRTTRVFYSVGDKQFQHDHGECVEKQEGELAFDYIRETFGKELANNYIIPFLKENTWNALYFSGQKEIAGETYEVLKEEQKDLTAVKSLDKILNKSNKR